MRSPTRSYLKVPYDLRIAKQIERRMIIDALQRMAHAGFEIRDYQYTGMGSIHFVDFVLFHRFLGLQRMLNVEFDGDIIKRVTFNRPFRNIKLQFDHIGNIIPKLHRDLKHILWLDYDDVLNPDIVMDVATATAVLSRGSILLITVDTNPPLDGRPKDWRRYFVEHLKQYCNPGWTTKSFTRSNLFRINVEVLEVAIKQGLAGREVSFLPIFNFLYADTHEMLTIGGVIGSEVEKRSLDDCDFGGATYVRRDLRQEPYRIRKIMLTSKEKIYLNAQMPLRRGWHPKEFEISAEDVRAYGESYRFFPTYAELLM